MTRIVVLRLFEVEDAILQDDALGPIYPARFTQSFQTSDDAKAFAALRAKQEPVWSMDGGGDGLFWAVDRDGAFRRGEVDHYGGRLKSEPDTGIGHAARKAIGTSVVPPSQMTRRDYLLIVAIAGAALVAAWLVSATIGIGTVDASRHCSFMDKSPSSHRTDEQLLEMLDKNGDWVLNNEDGLIEGGVVASLRWALSTALDHMTNGRKILAITRLPPDGIIIFLDQMERLIASRGIQT